MSFQILIKKKPGYYFSKYIDNELNNINSAPYNCD